MAMGAEGMDRAVVEAAAHWYVSLQGSEASERDRRDWAVWLQADASHRQAWERLQGLERQWRHVPADLAVPVLNQAQRAARRKLVKTLAFTATTASLGWMAFDQSPWRVWLAQHRTEVGQQGRVRLADGSVVDLNTDTAVDVVHDERERLLRLHRGEIAVSTHAEARGRPFVVQTAQGRITALGTRFSVRSLGGATVVAVKAHTVDVRPWKSTAPAVRVQAGQQLRFSADQAGPLRSADPYLDAWAKGLLVVLDWRLDDFLLELGRYRRGHIACDPSVAGLRLSGAFKVLDTDAVLANLAASLPVRVAHVTRFWASVGPR
jgi:transmembrane sensor